MPGVRRADRGRAVDRDGSPRDSLWLRGIGPEYVELAFRWAHEADPGARLFYNDYGGEGLGRKSNAIYRLAQDLLNRGVPIHGVGLQMRLDLKWPLDPQALAVNMQRLGRLGLEVHVTEMDVRVQNGVGPIEKRLRAQAGAYGDVLRACLTAPNVTGLVMWGVADHHSWIAKETGRRDAPLLFDTFYARKPSYRALCDVLAAGS